MDKPNKPQTSDDEAAPAPAAPSLQARSPYRPLSRRRRQEQPTEPESQVERPTTAIVFDASPTTVAAVLAKAGGAPAEPVSLAWGRSAASGAGDAEVEADGRPESAAHGEADRGDGAHRRS